MKETIPTISIIIVNWNGKKWLERVLRSLMNQTYTEFEIILVDNNSSDDSISFVTSQFPSVRIIQNEKNVGFGVANNIGVKHAIGTYILLLNNDVWVESNFLEKLILRYKEKKCDVIGPCETEYDSPKFIPYYITIDPLGHQTYFFNENLQRKTFYLNGACVLLKKSLFERSSGFDEIIFMYCEEVDLFWRFHLMGATVYQDQTIFFHHASGGSRKKSKHSLYQTFLWRNQHQLYMLLKNYTVWNLLWVFPLYFVQNLMEIITFFFWSPKISLSYIQGWIFNIKMFPVILKKRDEIRKLRKISDPDILNHMYIGSAKFRRLKKILLGKIT